MLSSEKILLPVFEFICRIFDLKIPSTEFPYLSGSRVREIAAIDFFNPPGRAMGLFFSEHDEGSIPKIRLVRKHTGV